MLQEDKTLVIRANLCVLLVTRRRRGRRAAIINLSIIICVWQILYLFRCRSMVLFIVVQCTHTSQVYFCQICAEHIFWAWFKHTLNVYTNFKLRFHLVYCWIFLAYERKCFDFFCDLFSFIIYLKLFIFKSENQTFVILTWTFTIVNKNKFTMLPISLWQTLKKI